ncbi:ribonuclease HII [Natroniella acetigena]|uniref:ribonuclease HII n=1 Tax=Natroniella acetigena TaxID=52004 RepID=UPI00200B3C98|nr:ribonuclease HII [Natroniella acetigena]MCK8827119.1 ribonuclease HII [Natroniella acetigena]
MDLSKLTIKEVKAEVKVLEEISQELIEKLAADSRKGIQKLAQRLVRQKEKRQQTIAKFKRMSQHEDRLRQQGYNLIAGIDEAGRGPLAGPVVAAAVILPEDTLILGVDDSKKLSEKKREELFTLIQEQALGIGVGIIDSQTIDQINILQATYQAMREAIADLERVPDYLLIDAEHLPDTDLAQAAITEGDSNSVSIAAASIIAKVTRDRLLVEYDQQFPEYNLAQHKGYGTQEHIQALEQYGPTSIHRTSFKIVKNLS